MMRKLVCFLCWGKKCRLQITCEYSCSSPLQLEQTRTKPQKKTPKPTKTKPWKKHDAVDIPTEAEKQSFVGFEGVAQRLLLELVGYRRSACLLCRCWQPCGELGVCVQSRCAFRKSLNKGCGKRKKNSASTVSVTTKQNKEAAKMISTETEMPVIYFSPAISQGGREGSYSLLKSSCLQMNSYMRFQLYCFHQTKNNFLVIAETKKIGNVIQIYLKVSKSGRN